MTRPLFAYAIFVALFAGACALALSSVLAQGGAGGKGEQPGPAPAPAPGFPEWKDHRIPGPDEMFPALPSGSLIEGKPPDAFSKAVILDVPLAHSWQDDPVQDLPASSRAAARAMRYALEQQIDYLPNLYMFMPGLDTGNYMLRMRRFQAKLRFTAAFEPGKPPEAGTKLPGLEAAGRAFGAGLVFATAYDTGDAPSALCVRYRRGKGVEAAINVPLAAPEGGTLAAALAGCAWALCDGLAPAGAPVAEAPPLAASDAGLRLAVKLREGLESGNFTRAWADYEELKKLEAPSGRACTWAMEVFRGSGERGGSNRDEMLALALNTGVQGVRTAPHDVLLRGRLCRYATMWFKRDEWALEGLRQALRVQPANSHLLDWHAAIEFAAEPRKRSGWLAKRALPMLTDGRGDHMLATALFESGRYAEAVKHYLRAIERLPDEYDCHFGLGLCATYLGEALEKSDRPGPEGEDQRKAAREAFWAASDALVQAQRLDPTEMGWAYDYHPRAATYGFVRLPMDPETLERVMLSQAVATGLEPTSRTVQWDRLVQPLIDSWRRTMREKARSAPEGEDSEVWMLARLTFALADRNKEEIVATLRAMRKQGHRSGAYMAAMHVWGPLLDRAGKPGDEPKAE